ncbi:MAG: alpha/beta hydrolase [Actinomycetota bacterium]|nr:alpha/beta hydrolase [Actinomycetota bacterium]
MSSARVRVLERPGERTPVVFLHGITSSARTWEPFLEALPAGVRGVAFDMLGNGYTELHGARRPLTYEDLARQLVEVADELGIDRFAGVGHSMGCAPLLRVAWQRPDRQRGLLLESPTALGRPKLAPPMRLARFGPTRRLLEWTATPRVFRAQARKALREFAGRDVDTETLEREAGHAIAHPKKQVRGFVDLIGHSDPRAPATDVDRYERIACPVWILRGSEDHEWMPESHEDRFRDLIPAARVTRWEGIGHAPHIQAPDRFTELLNEFVAATKESARPGAGSGPRASDERGIS